MPGFQSLIDLIVDRAAAQAVSIGAQQVAGPLVGNFTGGIGVYAANQLAYLIWTKLWVLAALVAGYNIVRAGIKLINSQEEDKLTKARRTIVTSLVGVMALYLVPRIVDAIYTGGAVFYAPFNLVFETPGGVTLGASIFTAELYGIIRWVEVMIVPVAIGIVVYSGFRIITTFGKEEGPAVMRRAIASLATGIILLLIDPAIKATLGIPNFGLPGTPSTAPIIARGLGILNSVLLLLSLAAIVIVVYAGIRLVVSLGNEEEQTKAKSLLVRAIIGMTIVFLSFALSVTIVAIASS